MKNTQLIATTHSCPVDDAQAVLLRKVTQESTVSSLEYTESILGGSPSLGYETLARWIEVNRKEPGAKEVIPAANVALFAEAALAGITLKEVETRFPTARGSARALLDHMYSQHPAIMDKMPNIYEALPSRPTQPRSGNRGQNSKPRSVRVINPA